MKKYAIQVTRPSLKIEKDEVIINKRKYLGANIAKVKQINLFTYKSFAKKETFISEAL